MKRSTNYSVICFLVLLSVGPLWAVSEEPNASSVFKQEELEQILAPLALYPDSLLSQILMASTYPMEVVQAERWARQNKDLQGDALNAALEKENWDPSVKSLVNFPQVLTRMSDKLDWTQKLGDAFLAQQKDVMDSVQKLRSRAQEQGALKTTEQQAVKTEQQAVVIESADPNLIYVPVYNPDEVYGEWPYEDYPPYGYYPEDYYDDDEWYPAGSGFALGAAWGYARGNPDWNRGDIVTPYGSGKWQHNPANRRGAPYRDSATAQKFNRASTPDAIKSREEFRGRAEQVRQTPTRAAADRPRAPADTDQRRQSAERRPTASRDMSSRRTASRGGAFQDMDRGSSARKNSSRGQASRRSASRPSGGGGRSGGRGGRGGGRR
jgi:hypothetical protein